MEFNLEDYRLSDSTLQEMLAKPRTAKVRRTRGLFIRGPIPIEWVRQAALLPGKAAVAVGMAVWHGMGMEARGGALKLTPRLLNRLGVNRKSANRGLKRLASAGLLKVTRRRGRCPVVRIAYPKEVEAT
jgi:hypothetical protein